MSVSKPKLIKYPRQRVYFANTFSMLRSCDEDKVKRKILNLLGARSSRIYFSTSGRDSLYWVFKSIQELLKKQYPDIQKFKVIVPAFNFNLIPDIIQKVGFKCVYVDVKDFTINSSEVEKNIDKSTKVILATHLLGNPCKMDSLIKIKRKYKLYLVEDCAHCFGAKFNNQACGTFGDASIFSMHYTKPLHCLYGGVALINNPLLFEYFEQYKNIPKAPLLKELQILTKNNIQSVLLNKYVFSFFTWYLLLLIYKLAMIDLLDVFSKDDRNYICRLPQRIGRLNLNILDKKLDKIVTRNLEMVQLFKEFKSATKYSTQIIPLLYPLFVDDKQQAYIYFKNRCIDVKRVYSVNISHDKNTKAQLLEDHIIYIPFYPELSQKDRNYITSLLGNWQ